jgi:cell division protein FtsB
MSRRNTAQLIRSAIWPALAILVVANFAGYAMFGPNGLMSLGTYKTQIADRRVRLAGLEAQRDELTRHARLLDPHRVDPDYADELVRRSTGQVRPDEVIIPRQ